MARDRRTVNIRTRRLPLLYMLLPALILLGAAIVRFHLLGAQSLWNDEGNSLRLAQRALPDLIAAARLDIHPPGYYIALKGWLALTGDTEFALRALSALCGVVTVACTYALGKAIFSHGAGMIAAALVALNSFSVYYGQEARMYAALAMFAAASMLVFVRWMGKPTAKRAIVLAILNAAGTYTQYTFPAVMVVQGILFVPWWLSAGKRQRQPLIAYIGLNLLTIALYLPQFGSAIAQVTAWPRTGQPIGLGDGLATVTQWLVYGNTLPAVPWLGYVWPAVFVLVALILPDWIRRPQPSWWRRSLPWLWIVVTVGPLFALGLFREANLKFLLPVQIAAALIIGRGAWLLWEIGSPALMVVLVEALPRIAAGVGLLWFVMVSSDGLNHLYSDPQFARDNYRAMAQVINAHPRPGDAIILDAPNQQEVFTYYYHGPNPIYALPAGLGGDDPATVSALDKIIADHRRIFVLFWGEDERDPNLVVEKTLAAQAFDTGSIWYGNVRFAQYATLPTGVGTTTAVNAKFGDSITLQSVTVSAATIQPPDALGVTLQWTTDKPLTQRYKVFVQLLDSSGNLIAQHDAEPGNNLIPTTTWQPGQPIKDSHGLAIPIDTPPGDYTLITGLYDANNPQSRLPVGASDHLTIGVIHITS